jgi:hypothetical protein
MNARSDVSKCARPECNSSFVRFGDGQLFVFPVADPKAWDLPDHARQKVFWLCEDCCSEYYVRLDRRHHTAHVAHRPERNVQPTRKVA